MCVWGKCSGPRGGSVPTWFWEGTASVLAREGASRDPITLAWTAIRSGAPRLEDLEASFPREATAAAAAYVTAFAFVQTLSQEKGTESLGRVTQRVAHGEEFVDVFQDVYGGTPTGMAAAWRRGFLWRYRWVPILTSGTTLWLGVTGLFLLAWWRKRRRSSLLMELWELEEQIEEDHEILH